jgi:hypothetical protein
MEDDFEVLRSILKGEWDQSNLAAVLKRLDSAVSQCERIEANFADLNRALLPPESVAVKGKDEVVRRRSTSSNKQLRLKETVFVAFLQENLAESQYSSQSKPNFSMVHTLKDDGAYSSLYVSDLLDVEFSPTNPKMEGSKSFAMYESFSKAEVIAEAKVAYAQHHKDKWPVELTAAFGKGCVVSLASFPCPTFPYEMCVPVKKEKSSKFHKPERKKKNPEAGFDAWLDESLEEVDDEASFISFYSIAERWIQHSNFKGRLRKTITKFWVADNLRKNEKWRGLYEKNYRERVRVEHVDRMNVLVHFRFKTAGASYPERAVAPQVEDRLLREV